MTQQLQSFRIPSGTCLSRAMRPMVLPNATTRYPTEYTLAPRHVFNRAFIVSPSKRPAFARRIAARFGFVGWFCNFVCGPFSNDGTVAQNNTYCAAFALLDLVCHRDALCHCVDSFACEYSYRPLAGYVFAYFGRRIKQSTDLDKRISSGGVT